jgi:hypothetical protein
MVEMGQRAINGIQGVNAIWRQAGKLLLTKQNKNKQRDLSITMITFQLKFTYPANLCNLRYNKNGNITSRC